ncbi:hypothetical protein Q7P37_006827 [Cladosporium fusiforme]
MSRQQISQHYSRLLTRWPIDRLRPAERHFQRLLQQRIQAAPAGPRDESREVNAAYLLLDNALHKRHRLSDSIMHPTSNPDHYTALAKELEEAPDRTWFGNWKKRMQNLHTKAQPHKRQDIQPPKPPTKGSIAMSVTGSPASLRAISPVINSADATFDIFHILGQGIGPFSSPTSSTRSSKSVSTTVSPVPTPRRQTVTTPTRFTPPTPIAEDVQQDTVSSDGTTPLHSIIADRVTLMTAEEAIEAEHALKEHGSDWYECSGLFDRHNSNDDALPHRAYSAPARSGNLPSLDQTLGTAGKSAKADAHRSKASGTESHKPTAQEWMADIDCVSGVLGAMLADDDRGPR